MINITFPSTNIVKCRFSFKNHTGCSTDEVNEFGRIVAKRALKDYYYKVPQFLQGLINSGDTVLVYCTAGYQLCEVTTINVACPINSKELAPVVCKVDLTLYWDSIIEEQKLHEMRKVLDMKKKQIESSITYELIAEKNPEFAAMLKEFKEAGGTFE